MKVSDLIAALQKFPPDTEVEVNDNVGEIYHIEQVEIFPGNDGDFDGTLVVIQVNC